jgi:hypothetical protein
MLGAMRIWRDFMQRRPSYLRAPGGPPRPTEAFFMGLGRDGTGMMQANIFEGFAEPPALTFEELKRRNGLT